MKTVFEQRCEITKQMAELKIQLAYLQYHCQHERVNVVLTDDGFVCFEEHTCKDCGKFWTEDQ